MNYSYAICNFFVTSTNLISSFFLQLGNNVFDKEISFSTLTSIVINSNISSIDMFSVEGILSSILSISSFALIINFSFRYILIKVLILLSPFAILCISNVSTKGFFNSWAKCLSSLLLLQIIISVILLIPYSLIYDSSNVLFNKVLIVGSFIALIKSNQFVREFIGGIGIDTNFQSGISGIKSLLSR